jgi:O-antigen ligase
MLKSTGQPIDPGSNLLEKGLLWSATAAASCSLLSISAVQSFWAVAAILGIILLLIKSRRLAVPGFFWPLLVYAGWSLLAAAASTNPAVSLPASRKLLIFLIVPIVPAAFSRGSNLKFAVGAIYASGLIASIYALAYFFLKARKAAEPVRIRGFMGHYMTQGGVLALFLAFALALLIFSRGKPRWAWAAVLVPAGAALMFTLARNAWLGAGAAVALILAIWKPKALLLVPIAAGLLYAIGPAAVKLRVRSIFDTHDNSSIARLEYARAGLKIIGERPVFGTGPNTVHVVFQDPKYGLSDYARPNVHLHNNLLQIAAERGLPALLAWLAFLGWAVLALFNKFKQGGPEVKALAAAGLAAVTALVVAGFFEYNFGDAEVAMFFFLIITLPFAGDKAGGRA